MISSSNAGIVKRVIPGLASTVLYQVIAMANALFLIPLFIHAWGADGYGRWLGLTAVVSYLGLLDLGGQNYIGNLLAQHYARHEEDRFRQVLSEGLSLFLVISISALLVLSLFVSLPWLPIPGQGRALGVPGRIILLCMGASFLVSIPQGVYVTVFRATGKFTQGTMAGNMMRFVTFLLSVALLWIGIPQDMYAVFFLTATIILTLLIVIYGYRLIPLIRNTRLTLRDARAGLAHLGGSLYFWLLATANAVGFQGIIVVLSATSTPVVVAIFATHRTASGTLGYIANLFMAPVWPELTFLHARNEKARLAEMSLLTTRVVVFLSAVAAVALWVVLPLIYSVWTRRALAFDQTLLLLLLVQGTLAAGWNAASWPLLAANRHHPLALWSLVRAAVTIMLALILARNFGTVGAAAAALTADVFLGLLVNPVFAARFIERPLREVFLSIAIPSVTILLAGAAVHLLIGVCRNFVHPAVSGGAAALLLVYPALLLGLGKRNLRRLMDLLSARHKGSSPAASAPGETPC